MNQFAKKNEFSRSEKLFILFSMLTGFLISAEYSITRSASSAIFLSVFSAKDIPIIWLISVPFNLLVVSLYNRYLLKIGPLRMIAAVAGIIAFVHCFCACALAVIPWFIFVQFILKDVYILLMFKQLWSMIHSTIKASRAKYLYGCIFCMGTIGAICGSLIPSLLAVRCGSERLFFFTIPIYCMVMFCYWRAFQKSALREGPPIQKLDVTVPVLGGFSLIRRSSLLFSALVLVVLMQISVGMMDYMFNAHLEMQISIKDVRTEYIGQIVGATNLLSCFFQIVGGFLMVRFFGVVGSHLFIPMLLLGNALTYMAMPSFTMISFSYVMLKGVDFSLFGIVREMLYIPMSLDEKFRAKAIIDVFAYRSAKALVALCILVLQMVMGPQLLSIVQILSILIFIGWVLFVLRFLRKAYVPSISKSS